MTVRRTNLTEQPHIVRALLQEAKNFAKILMGQRSLPQAERQNIERRSAEYRPFLEGDYRCPHCWIRNGLQHILKPRQTTLKPPQIRTSEGDVLSCLKCDSDFNAPFQDGFNEAAIRCRFG
jgi:hypothetical protein